MPNTPGVDHVVAPLMTQAQIDALQPQMSGRVRYRLKAPGQIAIGQLTVMGPQNGGAVASQLVWMSAAGAAEFGTLLELAP
jgi:hypothetical protein